VSADRAGCSQLGERVEFGIERTGSYGAGLTSLLRRRGHRVIEVNQPVRQVRYLRGKNNTLDAENAARARRACDVDVV
jgi:transposase